MGFSQGVWQMPVTGDLIDGRYELLVRLGEGSFGEVWKARDTKFKSRLAALKLLKQEHMARAEILERFETEAEALARLQHENIVGISDRGTWAGGHFIAMEYIAGRSLRDWLKEYEAQGRVPELPVVIDLFDQVCAGVAAAHAVSIVHRDLKPENIILWQRDDRSVAKILDFGIARVDGRSSQSRTGVGMGTVAYMAPEQAVGAQSEIAPATDVFGLGVILVEMLSLCPYPSRELGSNEPWWALVMRDDGAVLSKVTALRAHVPTAIWNVIVAALRREPINRYNVAGSMRRALRAAWSDAQTAQANIMPVAHLVTRTSDPKTMPLLVPPAQHTPPASEAPGGSVAGATIPNPDPVRMLTQRRVALIAGGVVSLGCGVALSFALGRSPARELPATESTRPSLSTPVTAEASPFAASAAAAELSSPGTQTTAEASSPATSATIAEASSPATSATTAKTSPFGPKAGDRPSGPREASPNVSNGTMGEFDRSAASKVLGDAALAAKSCKSASGPRGTGRIKVVFEPGGRATFAQVQGPPFAGTAVGSCVNGVFLKRAQVPPFDGPLVIVSKSFSIP
ncbi:protein kinase domain-containing protein [Sorangium sp. So ce1099]|uniref:serine/threonine-protein kinase n=1 Tax=Sorangium sp. So ce1099 TaxID=3133331 RepID=UPI003F644394